jgi:tetratricopeptide (TPR) repeat protein
MTDNISQTGSGNIGISNVKDSEITILIGKSLEYHEMLARLKELEENLADIAPDRVERLNELNEKIDKQKRQIEQFKQGVTQLAETFSRIDVDTTDRLKRAREFFEKGDFGEARAVLETELEQMNDEHTRLLAQKEKYETDTLPKLKHNAEEFLVLAQATTVDFNNPHRFEDTCRYYEQSIAANAFSDNLFNYAKLLQEYNQFHLAEPYYQRVLREFRNELSAEYYAVTLNNLAVLHRARNEYEAAEAEFTEALAIYRKSAEKNPQTYLPDVADTLNNLAVLHAARNEYEAAEAEYNEALAIRRGLAAKNPQAYLPDVAMTLNNLAVLHCARNEHEAAEAEYNEALAIRRGLAAKNPQAYLPDVAMTLINFAIFFIDKPDRERSIALALEAARIIESFIERAAYTQKYLETAIAVLKNWGMTKEDIEKLVDN